MSGKITWNGILENAFVYNSSSSIKTSNSRNYNTFIALFKDTPLIAIVGLLELVGMIDLAKTNPKWLGFAAEGYVFAALVYFVFCYSMSRYSQN